MTSASNAWISPARGALGARDRVEENIRGRMTLEAGCLTVSGCIRVMGRSARILTDPAPRAASQSPNMPKPTSPSLRLFRQRVAWTLALCLLLCGEAPAAPLLPSDEYAVFRALLDHGLGPEAQQVVVAESTTGDPAGILPSAQADDARAKDLGTSLELLRDWSLMNQRTFTLGEGFSTRVPHVLLADPVRETLFRGDQPEQGWQLFFRKYPQSAGLVRLSRVGFNAARSEALVYLEFQCGAECGSGRLVQLARDPAGNWRIVSGELLWIAAPEAAPAAAQMAPER